MNFTQPNANAFVPDGQPLEVALSRTTLLGVGAHQDDLELMAYFPILKAFTTEGEWLTGVTVTNGAGPARAGMYKDYTDAQDLDWMTDKDKVVMRVDGHENLADALMGVFDSQISGGKRYDLATRGRRKANATFFESHSTDRSENLIFGMDLTPLVTEDSLEPQALWERYLKRFQDEVSVRLANLWSR